MQDVWLSLMEQPNSHPVPIQRSRNEATGSVPVGGQSSSASKTGQTPPYWSRKSRTTSNLSYTSIQSSQRPPAIVLEDNTEPAHHSESSRGLWAKGVSIYGHVVVSGSAFGSGAYVVWICQVEMLEVRL